MPLRINPTSGELDVVLNISTPASVPQGGTGRTTLTDGAILVGDGTNPVELIGPLIDGQLLIGDTAGVSPASATLTAPAAGFTITSGAGSITFALADGLAALEALAGTGIVVHTAADTYTERSIAVTASTGLSVSNGDGVAGNPTLAGIDASDTVKGVASYDENDFTVTSGDVAFNADTRLVQAANSLGGVFNIGVTVSAGVITITGANGSTLSATNPAYVVIPSDDYTGEKVIEVTADWSFQDDAGTSEIIGNLFGLTTGIAWADVLPMYIYFVLNDAEDTVMPMLCRLPHLTTSPAAAKIGAPDDAVADTQDSFFSFDNLTEADWESNPCICVGSLLATMTTSDDWTFSAPSSSSGIGNFAENVFFTYPEAQNGAATATHWWANAGTEPLFSTQQYAYQITRTGYMWINLLYDSVGTDGVGADTLSMTIPLNQRVQSRGLLINYTWVDNSAGNTFTQLISYGASTKDNLYMWLPGGTAFITNANFKNFDDFYMQGWLNLDN